MLLDVYLVFIRISQNSKAMNAIHMPILKMDILIPPKKRRILIHEIIALK